MNTHRKAALAILVDTERIVASVLSDVTAPPEVAASARLIDGRLKLVQEMLGATIDALPSQLAESCLDVAERLWEHHTAGLRQLQDRIERPVSERCPDGR